MHRLRAERDRLVGTFTVLVGAFVFAACSSGGGGGDSTLSPPAGSPASSAGVTSSVTVGWKPADGPVAGYAVYVQRGNDPYAVEEEVTRPQVSLAGKPGSKARVVVVAFDDDGAFGPSSPPSPTITFPGVASSAATAVEEPDAVAPITRSLAGSAGGAGSGLASDATSDDASATDADDAARKSAADPDAVVQIAGTLVWEAGDAMRVTDAQLETLQVFARPSAGARLAAVGDLDADGVADLVWSEAAGTVTYTPGAALAAGDATPHEYAALAADERVIGAGDFDGDGVDDLLVARASAVDVWFTTGSAIEVAEVGSADGSRLAGVGDFDGNGAEDVAWDAGDGHLAIWLMDASGAMANVDVELGAGVELLAVGDFDGDRIAEIAARDAEGNVVTARPMQDASTLEPTDLANAAAWQGFGSADLDLDGRDDLVLVGAGALRIGTLPGDLVQPLDAASPWTLTALLP